MIGRHKTVMRNCQYVLRLANFSKNMCVTVTVYIWPFWYAHDGTLEFFNGLSVRIFYYRVSTLPTIRLLWTLRHWKCWSNVFLLLDTHSPHAGTTKEWVDASSEMIGNSLHIISDGVAWFIITNNHTESDNASSVVGSVVGQRMPLLGNRSEMDNLCIICMFACIHNINSFSLQWTQ